MNRKKNHIYKRCNSLLVVALKLFHTAVPIKDLIVGSNTYFFLREMMVWAVQSKVVGCRLYHSRNVGNRLVGRLYNRHDVKRHKCHTKITNNNKTARIIFYFFSLFIFFIIIFFFFFQIRYSEMLYIILFMSFVFGMFSVDNTNFSLDGERNVCTERTKKNVSKINYLVGIDISPSYQRSET